MTTTYKQNEWLSAEDIVLYDGAEKINPDLYKVIGLLLIMTEIFFLSWALHLERKAKSQ